jgi:predicted metal-binding transcription factor (methanogenesis marker protein 9)
VPLPEQLTGWLGEPFLVRRGGSDALPFCAPCRKNAVGRPLATQGGAKLLADEMVRGSRDFVSRTLAACGEETGGQLLIH